VFPVIASAAKQSMPLRGAKWIASSQGLLAMTEKQLCSMGCIFGQTLKMRSGEIKPIGFMESIVYSC
jgi:hypothetical protein